jgi:hypothetical protein
MGGRSWSRLGGTGGRVERPCCKGLAPFMTEVFEVLEWVGELSALCNSEAEMRPVPPSGTVPPRAGHLSSRMWLPTPTDFLSEVSRAPVSVSTVDDRFLACIEFIDDELWCQQMTEELDIEHLQLEAVSHGQEVSMSLRIHGLRILAKTRASRS